MSILTLPISKRREGNSLKSKEKALIAARAALDKKAQDVVILDLKRITTITDYFIICSGDSTPQVKAIREQIEEKLGMVHMKPLGIEGTKYNHWILIDYGDIIVHVFEEDTRAYYELEKLWMDAKRIPVEEYQPL